jgi:hypothetical protein
VGCLDGLTCWASAVFSGVVYLLLALSGRLLMRLVNVFLHLPRLSPSKQLLLHFFDGLIKITALVAMVILI